MQNEPVLQWSEATVQALLRALFECDPYTYGHCRRVAGYSRMLARAAGLGEEDQRKIELAGLLHDLGKMGIPGTLLNKPGRLTPEEITMMKTHSQRSVEIIRPLSGIAIFGEIIPVILHHHERMDGQGYPAGIRGDEIPLLARMIAIVDTFDAITSNRAYRKALPLDLAYKELLLFSGRQFDPQLVKIFVQSQELPEQNVEEKIAA